MTNRLWTAILNPRSPRYGDWHAILGGDDVPLLSPQPFTMELPPDVAHKDVMQLTTCQAYRLGIQQMTQQQRLRLISWIQRKYGVRREDVVSELESKGFPIRDDDVIVAFSMRGMM